MRAPAGWNEEPASPDDVLAHGAAAEAVAPIRYLRAGAPSVPQIGAALAGGAVENVVILLLAARFGVPVCAGWCGTCRCWPRPVSGTRDDRAIGWVDQPHEHCADPAIVRGGRYLAPTAPGFSARINDEALARRAVPDGPEWSDS